MDFLDYGDISMEYRGSLVRYSNGPLHGRGSLPYFQAHGKLKLTDQWIIWKSGSRHNRKEEISADDVEMVNWQRLAGGWGIRIFTKDGSLHRLAGFKDAVRLRIVATLFARSKLFLLGKGKIGQIFQRHLQVGHVR